MYRNPTPVLSNVNTWVIVSTNLSLTIPSQYPLTISSYINFYYHLYLYLFNNTLETYRGGKCEKQRPHQIFQLSTS